MKFDVNWSRNSEAKLTRLWTIALNRAAITTAANLIDEQLTKDPLNVGESREGSRRILHEAPLGVIYSVNETDRTVLVLDVWSFMKRGDA